ncbi:hypothetical protein [Kingella potus]|uniref:hypothetical protein n=1 Tax=Kingella potus TaxID=265175 RepID=UPI001FD17125|nr:hypothetical protein [Kingella potus]UOP01537.1 hypothetical protein LVJ84_04920 [Kingella potus]
MARRQNPSPPKRISKTPNAPVAERPSENGFSAKTAFSDGLLTKYSRSGGDSFLTAL